MSTGPEHRESSRDEPRGPLGPFLAIVLFASLLFLLYYVAPLLQHSWANSGMRPPLYGRVLIPLSRNVTGVLVAGLVTAAFFFCRRR